MVLALKDMTIRGELRTNVEALIKILEHPDFMYVTGRALCVFPGVLSCLRLSVTSFVSSVARGTQKQTKTGSCGVICCARTCHVRTSVPSVFSGESSPGLSARCTKGLESSVRHA